MSSRSASPVAAAAAIGYLGLGSNLGDRRGCLETAAAALAHEGIDVLACSSTYETEPVGEVLDQPRFLNACIRVRSVLEPEALLDACQRVERGLGREPGGRRHAPRPIDIDILLLGERAFASGRLQIPHPALLERRFALICVLELAWDASTPDGRSLAQALARLPVRGQDVRLAGPALRGLSSAVPR